VITCYLNRALAKSAGELATLMSWWMTRDRAQIIAERARLRDQLMNSLWNLNQRHRLQSTYPTQHELTGEIGRVLQRDREGKEETR
jgi:hypothetical protein